MVHVIYNNTESHIDTDIQFLQYILKTLQDKKDIIPTIFVRYIPDHIDFQQLTNNLHNALTYKHFVIYGGPNINTHTTLVQNSIPIFKNKFIPIHTQTPIIFAIDLKHLLHKTQLIRNIINYFDTQQISFAPYWNTIFL